MNNSQQLAVLIKTRAKEIGKTQLQIAKECDISRNFMQSMKKEGYMPRLENLCKLADCLDCSVDYLLGRTDKPNLEAETIKDSNNTGGLHMFDFTVPVTTYPASGERQQEIVSMLSEMTPRQKHQLMSMIYDFYDECKKGSE